MSDIDPRIVELFAAIGVAAESIPSELETQIELASDAVIARGDRYSLSRLAELSMRPVDDLRRAFAETGIVIDDPEAILFDDRDIGLAAFFVEATSEVFEEDEGVEILNVIGSAMRTLADAGVAQHVQGPESRTADDAAASVALNTRSAEIGMALADHLPALFRHHLRRAAQRQRRTQSTTHREVAEMSVGFVDLVGYTALSETLEPAQLVALLRDFERRAHELATGLDARVTKLIGDEVMFVAEASAPAVAFATGMVETYGAGSVMPRGGVAAGSLVTLHGDFFGPIVNLAARLVDAAVPGEVLVTDVVASDPGVTAEPAGRRMMRGITEPVSVWSITTG